MNYALTLSVVVVILFAAMKSMRWVLNTAVMALAFTPYYLVVPIGKSLFPARAIILIVLGFLCVLWARQNGQAVRLMIEKIKVTKSILLLTTAFIFFSPIISAQLGSTENWSLVSIGLEFIYFIGVLLLMLLITRSQKAIYGVMVAITMGLIVSEILALVEYQSKQVLLNGLIEASNISGTEFFTDRARDSIYRVRAMFDNHLMFAEYITISWPLAWVVYKNSKAGLIKWIAGLSLVLVPGALILSGARSGWMVFALGVGFLLMMKMHLKLAGQFRLMVNIAAVLAFSVIAYNAILIMNSPEQYFTEGGSAGESAIERVVQFGRSYDLVMESPWVGYGKGLDLGSESFLMFIDSYMLVVLLEGGFVGLFVFVLIWLVMLKHARALIRYSKPVGHESNIALALMTALISLLAFQFFISVPWNNIYLYVIEGLIVSQLAHLHLRLQPSQQPKISGFRVNAATSPSK